jgi:hypothetical protein
MSTRPSSRAEIPSRFLDFSMLCRQENFPPAIFGASRPSMAMRAVSKQGAGLRSAPESFPRNPKTAPPFDSRSARSAARPSTTSCGFEDSETIPFPGPDSIFSSRCGAISGQLRLSRGRFRNEARCFHREGSCALREAATAIEFGHRRDHHGDGMKPSRDRGLVGERAARNGQSQNARAWAGSEPRTTIGYDNSNFVLQKNKF